MENLSEITKGFYWYWINSIPRVGLVKIHKLLEHFGNPKRVFFAKKSDYLNIEKISENDAKAIEESKEVGYILKDYIKLRKSDMKFSYPGKEDYPKQLLDIENYPVNLYYYGRLPDFNKPIVSIVGARGCTDYGRRIAYEFAKSFAANGIQVISGMALGIDYYGQKGAISAGGYSLGVLGTGADVCYPRNNLELYLYLKKNGGILSEYKPNTPAIPGHFPERNRIISALSDAVIVVEARNKSGSKITVDWALEQGKDVFVVPGRISDPLSVGCLELLKEGANPILRPEDIYQCDLISTKSNKNQALSSEISPQNEQFRHNLNKLPIASPKNMVYSELDLYPCALDDLVTKTRLPLSIVVENLLELELEGLVEETTKNCYVRVQI